MRVLAPETVLDAASLFRVAAKLRQGSPNADQQLLAEATYLAKGEPGGGGDRATLLAAIAVEVRTKRALRQVATGQQAEMLDLLLENPRDWSLSAHGLFLKALPIICGTPPTAEHKAVAKRVQALFTARNKIAHTGESLPAGAASDHVQTAWEAFALIDALVEAEQPGPQGTHAGGAAK